MALLTTTIGAYPKPDYVPVPDWFRMGSTTSQSTNEANIILSQPPPELEEILDRGTRDVVSEQVRLGIDVPTDGEIRRENYIHYHCRHLKGIDFNTLTSKSMRNGSWHVEVPTITAPVSATGRFLIRDWEIAQSATRHPVKITLPGPLTLIDSLADAYYNDEQKLGQTFAQVLNVEIKALAEAGCQWIQVDEPLLAREPEKALAFSIDQLEQCFHQVPKTVNRTVHICCGYPDVVDNEDFLKADPTAYLRLADRLDQANIDVISLEDAHRHNDLALLEHFKQTTIIFGVVAVARSRIETVELIKARLSEALGHIDASRLMVAPDCGLGMLDAKTVQAKLKNMVEAAKAVG